MDSPSRHLHVPNPQFLTLQWDEFCALLGGATWTDACIQFSFENLSPERRQLLPLLASRFTDQRQFLFSNTTESAFPFEIFWLKWRLFAGLCARVLALHYPYQIGDAARQFAKNQDGTKLAALDKVIPKSDQYKGKSGEGVSKS
jgi:hypothetical protein